LASRPNGEPAEFLVRKRRTSDIFDFPGGALKGILVCVCYLKVSTSRG